VKLAAWQRLAIGVAMLLATGSLHAATPENLPEPIRRPASVLQQGPAQRSAQQQSATTTQNDFWSDFGNQGQSSFVSQPDMDAPPSMGFGPAPTQNDPRVNEPCAYPYSSGQWWRNGCWYGGFDFVVWNRTQPFSRVLGFDATAVGVFFNDDLNKHGNQLPVEAGARGTLGYFLDRDIDNRDHSFEFTYLGFNNWEGVDGLISENPQQLFVPDDPSFPGFNAADTYATFYRSSFQSMEVNYRIRNRPERDRMVMGPDGFWSRQEKMGCTQSLFVGLRGISEQERYLWLSRRNQVAAEDFGGENLVNTKNWLLGFQVGGDFMQTHETWYWGVKGDAGIYCNFTSGTEHIVGIDPAATGGNRLIDASASNQTAAFFGELTFMAGYNINDHFIVHAGWDLGLLGGLAVAPDNVSFDTYMSDKNPFLNTGSQIFYTGLSLGFECYW
jgi:hypothetical protein